MAYCDKIFTDIVSDCSTRVVGGLETEAYFCKRADVTFTKVDNLISSFTVESGAKLYKYTGNGLNHDGGFDLIPASATEGNKFTHYVSLRANERGSAIGAVLDNLEDVVFFIVTKHQNTGGDGDIVVLGAESGLFHSSGTRRYNTESGTRPIELTSREGQEERYSEFFYLNTDRATSIADLEAALIEAV